MAIIVQEPAKPRPAAVPIEILSTDTAKLYTHLHPILVLSLYAFKWQAIVADPVPALWNTLIWLGFLQVAYAALCLPPTTRGGSSSTAIAADKKKPGERKKGGPGRLEAGFNQKLIPAFISLVAAITAGIPILAITLILFGAPITTHHEHTLLCAAHVSFLGVIPLVYVQGLAGATWKDIVALLQPIDEVYGSLIGTVLGAWLGAVPIPLDWDREWQKWPITIVTGAYIGFAVGKLVGGTLLKGKKIMFD